ncbi:MAG: hypothetical protein MMC23_006279 [Stictis urceolatum]|nr:hypothetical protein [Stictis urceolata]
MADGLNDARAMRIAEVMNEFRTIQHRIASLEATPPASEYQELGYSILRECQAQAQAVLSAQFDSGALNAPSNNSDVTKRSLQRILLDASARRFRAQRIYLRASAAVRWVNRRRQILNGQASSPSHAQALRQVDNTLRAEIATVTDARVYNELRARDQAAGHWLGEMTDLNTLLAYIRTH